MEENAEEDVVVEIADMSEIDNAEVIDLIEGKPSGILSILNEECVVPKGTDATFADKLFQQCITNKRLKRPLKKREAFQIFHFAGQVCHASLTASPPCLAGRTLVRAPQVTYTTAGILEKNKDPVSEDLLVILKGSDEPAVRQLFSENPDEAQLMLDRKKGAKFQGVVAKFQHQLTELLAIVESSETHFVRCIKPNGEKQPRSWADEMVSKQLRCSGIMEAVRVIAAGYPDRVPHHEILGRFGSLVTADVRPSADKDGEKAAATRTLSTLGLRSSDFVPGNTKMFLKAGVLNELRVMREKKIFDGAMGMQAAVRGMIARKAYRVLWEQEQERRRREDEERKRREEEERLRREEEERRWREEEELAKLAEVERQRIQLEERARREAEERQLLEEEERRRKEEEMHRLAQETLEREREEEEITRAAEESKRRFRELRGFAMTPLASEAAPAMGAASTGSSTGFKLDMGRVAGAAQKAAELEPDMAKWTPRARPKDAPKQSARYQTDFKALPEDVLESSPPPPPSIDTVPVQTFAPSLLSQRHSRMRSLRARRHLIPSTASRYAVYLGMEPSEDTDLLWIAEEVRSAKIPVIFAQRAQTASLYARGSCNPRVTLRRRVCRL